MKAGRTRLCSSSGLAFAFPQSSFASSYALRGSFNTQSSSFLLTRLSVRTKTYVGLHDPEAWYDDEKENLGGRWPYFEEPEEFKRWKGKRGGIISQRPERAHLFPRIPEPRKGETVASFLKKLKESKSKIPGNYKDWDKLEAKFKSWEHLFSCKREDMRKLGIKSCQVRKFLLGWMEKYRQGVDPGTCKYNLYYNRFNS